MRVRRLRIPGLIVGRLRVRRLSIPKKSIRKARISNNSYKNRGSPKFHIEFLQVYFLTGSQIASPTSLCCRPPSFASLQQTSKATGSLVRRVGGLHVFNGVDASRSPCCFVEPRPLVGGARNQTSRLLVKRLYVELVWSKLLLRKSNFA